MEEEKKEESRAKTPTSTTSPSQPESGAQPHRSSEGEGKDVKEELQGDAAKFRDSKMIPLGTIPKWTLINSGLGALYIDRKSEYFRHMLLVVDNVALRKNNPRSLCVTCWTFVSRDYQKYHEKKDCVLVSPAAFSGKLSLSKHDKRTTEEKILCYAEQQGKTRDGLIPVIKFNLRSENRSRG